MSVEFDLFPDEAGEINMHCWWSSTARRIFDVFVLYFTPYSNSRILQRIASQRKATHSPGGGIACEQLAEQQRCFLDGLLTTIEIDDDVSIDDSVGLRVQSSRNGVCFKTDPGVPRVLLPCP